MTRLLVVDDAIEHAQMVMEFLRASGEWPHAEIQIAASYEAALAKLTASPLYDLAVVDYMLGSRDGLELLRELKQRGIDTAVILLTGHGAEDVAVEAMKAGAADYLSKSNLTIESLERAVRFALALRVGERQRRQAEAALRASEERFRALVENSSDALLLLDEEGRVTYVSPSSSRHLGWGSDEMLGGSIFDFLHPDDRDSMSVKLAEVLRSPGKPVHQDIRLQHADGSWRAIESVAANRLSDPSVAAIVVNARDITDRRKLEEQLRHAQKMEAVGQLAGGIAHDFNNLLTAILGYCNLMRDDMPPEDPLRADLDEIHAAGERAASLTRQLLAFSRRQMLQPQVIDINVVVQQLEKLLRRLISEDVELVTALASDLMTVRVDPASIEQILVNLAVNARDAMPAGGRLTIETDNIDLDETFAISHVPMKPARYVMLAVGDTGQGMDADTRARVFEPFFTTKEQGKGSGLGLATVYGMVKQSGGYIWVYSEPGHGTVFKVYFPPAQQRLKTTDADNPGRRASDAMHGWETVLLVEDEDAVRALAREVLRRHGYVVLEARHGVDALRMAERHPDDIHLMVTDLVMPHMGGRDLVERLIQVRPKMKVLFMSGYTDHAVMHRELTPGTAFLQKPFTPEAFAKKVRTVLDQQTVSG
ncbi:MAG TPA: response regulator [Vicinamibacterales bacterium]|nr:response regulator [Vicinamibacterales bacterium]